MIKNQLYFAKTEFHKFVKVNGGESNDKKIRPLYCCFQSIENEKMYWAIPIGNLDHRDKSAQDRINKYLGMPSNAIQSCFYHIGKTNIDSIFFISDIVPICDEFIERPYFDIGSGLPIVITEEETKNEVLRKAYRILAYEKSRPNYFRQKITVQKNEILRKIAGF